VSEARFKIYLLVTIVNRRASPTNRDRVLRAHPKVIVVDREA